ncbi:hypothetical protein TNCV_1374831 [Trichonephila clavipes]|nr:hypothetical protein TNCV_1374831 [Trichonephila clavipes]
MPVQLLSPRQCLFNCFLSTMPVQLLSLDNACSIAFSRQCMFNCFLSTMHVQLLSLDNACSIAFSQRNSSTHLIEDETSNNSDIINNLIDYQDGQEEPDSLRAEEIYTEIQLSNK